MALIIDYDYNKKIFTPVIFDSVGRSSSFKNYIEKIYKGAKVTTCDNELSNVLEKIFEGESLTKMKRMDYDHQQPLLELKCGGSYAFSVMYLAIDYYEPPGDFKRILQNIGKPDTWFFGATSFLTPKKNI